MKILFLTGSFPPPRAGGSIEYIFNIISNLPAYSVIVHTGNTDSNEAVLIDKKISQKIIRSKFISTVIGNKQRPKFIAKLIAFREYLIRPVLAFLIVIRERPDIIHIGEVGFVGFTAILSRMFFKIPFVIYTYAEEISQLRILWLHRWWLIYILRKADAIVTVSDYTRQLLIECGVQSKNIHKIVPAVGSQKVLNLTNSQIENVKKKYKINNMKVLLTVARLQERKNHIAVIEAMGNILCKHKDLCYIIAGIGPLEEYLKNHVRKYNLESRVIFTGYIDDEELACLYGICDVFVMPHRQLNDTMDTEGCPTVFLEASAHGKPVIGGDAGGVSDAIVNGKTGFIINGADNEALAETIIHLLDKPTLAKKMGNAGREYVSNFTPENNAIAVWELSKSLI